ncbi:MAG: selenide, water dikinase SelD, partial [Rikenellaceae bacterium]
GRIIEGGVSKVNEAGAFVMGGHTINDPIPKYGLAVVGSCSPSKIITNSALEPNKTLILTKPLGVGVVIAAKRLGLATSQQYQTALETMKTLNKTACEVMCKYEAKAATDITGFGLIGHLDRMALSSGVSIQIECSSLPVIDGVESIISQGCVPATAMNNLRVVGDNAIFSKGVSLERKILCCDAQTSGGILMAIDDSVADSALNDLKAAGCLQASIVGRSVKTQSKRLYFY